jgi:Domain of unknown function (DUF4123)
MGDSISAEAACNRRTLVQKREISLEQCHQFADDGYLWAIIDACDIPATAKKLSSLSPDRARALLQPDYWAVAPYLVYLDSETLCWLCKDLWTIPWGIFVMSKKQVDELFAHFVALLVRRLPDGKDWFFRYYDPRVLPPFLETCNTEELKAFYGPVRGYAVGNHTTGQCTAFVPMFGF